MTRRMKYDTIIYKIPIQTNVICPSAQRKHMIPGPFQQSSPMAATGMDGRLVSKQASKVGYVTGCTIVPNPNPYFDTLHVIVFRSFQDCHARRSDPPASATATSSGILSNRYRANSTPPKILPGLPKKTSFSRSSVYGYPRIRIASWPEIGDPVATTAEKTVADSGTATSPMDEETGETVATIIVGEMTIATTGVAGIARVQDPQTAEVAIATADGMIAIGRVTGGPETGLGDHKMTTVVTGDVATSETRLTGSAATTEVRFSNATC